MSCPMSGCGIQDKPRKDSSIAISINRKNRLIDEAAAQGIDLKKHLENILDTEHWGAS